MSSIGQKICEFFKKQGAGLAFIFLHDPLWEKFKRFLVSPRWAKARLVLGIVLVVLVIAILVIPETSLAGPVGWFVAKVLGWILWFVASLLALILAALGWVFNFVINRGPFQQVISHEAVRIGWTAVRDICNLAFVLILLGIGFATILRVPTYHIKKLIVPFIVALLLINFSKLICGVITDFCHVIMASFAAAMTNGDNYSGAIAEAIGVGKWLDPGGVRSEDLSNWDYVQAMGMICIFLLALIFSFLLIVILLVVRWITLIVLTIFSPLVYAAQILPTTRGFAKKWWQQFLQNAFYGPAVVFMVYLAIVIVRNAIQTDGGLGGGTSAPFGGSNVITPQTLLSMIVACVILYKAVTMARNMGISGAGAVISTGTKWGKRLGGAAVAPLTERVKSAWQARSKAVKEKRAESGVRAGLAIKTAMDRGRRGVFKGVPLLGRETRIGRGAILQRNQVEMAEQKKIGDAERITELDDAEIMRNRSSATGTRRRVYDIAAAKRGLLNEADYKASRNRRGNTPFFQSQLDDAVRDTNPLAYLRQRYTGQQLEDESLKLFKKLDPKKIGAAAWADTTNGNNEALVKKFIEVRKPTGGGKAIGEAGDALDRVSQDKLNTALNNVAASGTNEEQKGAALAYLKIKGEAANGGNLGANVYEFLGQKGEASDLAKMVGNLNRNPTHGPRGIQEIAGAVSLEKGKDIIKAADAAAGRTLGVQMKQVGVPGADTDSIIGPMR